MSAKDTLRDTLWFIYVPEQNKVQIRFTPDGRNIYTIWSL
jgi:hypothetical protein